MKKLMLVTIVAAISSVHAEEVIFGPPPTRFDRIENFDYINNRPTVAMPKPGTPVGVAAPNIAAAPTPVAAPVVTPVADIKPVAPATPIAPAAKSIAIPQAVTVSPSKTQATKTYSDDSMMMTAQAQKQAQAQRPAQAQPVQAQPVKKPVDESLAPNQDPAEFKQLDQMPETNNADAPQVTPQVFITINKTTQSITIESPDGTLSESSITADVPWGKSWSARDTKVSTGGGLKRPKGKNAGAPHCAQDQTPNIPGKSVPGQLINGEYWLWIPAIEMDENYQIYTYGLNGPGTRTLTPDAIPKMTRVHYSQTFEDENGNTVPMQDAVRIYKGVFFHRGAEGYQKYLGQNVSGGCIRLSTRTAKLLYGNYDSYHDRKGRVVRNGNKPTLGLMKKYGGVAIRILGENPPMVAGTKAYCTPQMVAHVRNEEREASARGESFNAGGSIGSFFENLFGGPPPKRRTKTHKSY